MKQLVVGISLVLAIAFHAGGQVSIKMGDTTTTQTISKEIYGQFAEHLGRCIYGGIWVGKGSSIPNIDGYRTDVFQALKNLKVPVMRWPGGCFADDYHWTEGIGDPAKRPRKVNNWWGGSIEDNSFGTHEFLNLCELLGCEPYISGNVGSGTVEELSSWIEYMTSDSDSPMANLRRKNGREKPWAVKYLGVGNESWGCGGNMRPDYYSDIYRHYATYCRNYGGNNLFKIASGANGDDANWTDVLMKNVGNQMNGLSLHYYTVKTWTGSKGSATSFSNDEYYNTLGHCVALDTVISRHVAIMDKYDPKNQVALVVDEWGTWFDVEPNTNPGHLFQQNTMRDAMVAALSLNILHKYAYRVKMANIAQVVNVLQSMILTKDDKMVLTPTYFVFEMYSNHQGARYIPLSVDSPMVKLLGNRDYPAVNATASRDAKGNINISLVNIDLSKGQEVVISLPFAAKVKEGQILTSKSIADYNDFGATERVKPATFNKYKSDKSTLTVSMPARSIVTLMLTK